MYVYRVQVRVVDYVQVEVESATPLMRADINNLAVEQAQHEFGQHDGMSAIHVTLIDFPIEVVLNAGLPR